MRRMTKNFYGMLRMPLMAVVLFVVFACSNNDGPRFDTPSITLGIDEVINARTGTRVSVPITFNAGGGARSVVVFRDGGFLREIAVGADATQYTFETDPIPTSLGEGEEVEYQFLVSNLNDVDSERATLTIRAEVYDKITVGSTSLYDIAVPTDGVVTAGTTVKLIQGRNYHLGTSATFEVGTEVHIEEGVHVYLDADAVTPINVLFNGEVDIVGTATAPVVFTSSKSLTGGAAAGDWGEFRITGTGNESNNGTLDYVRIEYPGGRAFRLSHVGAATNISHVQVFKASGEGVMFTHGNARVKNIIATDCVGESFRIGDSYEGLMQFVISVNSENLGIKDDFSLRDQSKATIVNATITGPGADVAAEIQGIRMRGELVSEPRVYNTIVAEFPRRGVRVTDLVVVTDLNGNGVFAHSHVFGIGTQPFHAGATAFADTGSNPFHNSTEVIAGIGVNDFVPDAEQTSTFNPNSINSFFSSAPFVGAVRNAAEDWTRGWVKNPDGTIR